MKKQAWLGLLLAGLLTFSSCDGGGLDDLFRKKKNYYECEVHFYVTPTRSDSLKDDSADGSQYGVGESYEIYAMDNITELLSSEGFAEYLMLNGAALPSGGTFTVGEEERRDVSEELNAKIEYVNALEEETEETRLSLERWEIEKDQAYINLKSLWEYEAPHTGISEEYWTYSEEAFSYWAWQGIFSEEVMLWHEEYIAALNAQEHFINNLNQKEEEKEQSREAALALWRMTNEYAEQLVHYVKGITYSYDISKGDNVAKNFIYAKISVLEDEDLAEELLHRVINILPAYVEKNMVLPEGYDATVCKMITRLHEIVKVKK